MYNTHPYISTQEVSKSAKNGSKNTSPLPVYHGCGGRMREGERRADSASQKIVQSDINLRKIAISMYNTHP